MRDFALVTLAGELSAAFPGQLACKGGFVLRHAYGILRFSKDVDATRHNPPSHKFDADEVADAIRAASITNVVSFDPDEPATDSARSPDFDRVKVTGEVLPASDVQVEVSYREGVLGTPEARMIGAPYYEPFEILTMDLNEMAVEKLRTLAQRRRETDLADLAVMLSDRNADDDAIARFSHEGSSSSSSRGPPTASTGSTRIRRPEDLVRPQRPRPRSQGPRSRPMGGRGGPRCRVERTDSVEVPFACE